MAYMGHTVHWQFLGLVLAVLGLILTAATSGVNDWRVWYVDDLSVITSGVAWVGIWRACFYSHVLSTIEFCEGFSITDSFVPPEIAAAQVLCTSAIPIGIAGNLVAGYGVRCAYFNVNGGHIRRAFSSAGALYLLTATCSLVPVFWNVNSVLNNRTIDFPPEFHLPPAPYRQELGLGIAMGVGSSILLIVSGLMFFFYRPPVKPEKPNLDPGGTEEEEDPGIANAGTEEGLRAIAESRKEGNSNPTFETEEIL